MENKKFKEVRLLARQFATREEDEAFDAESRCVCALFTRFARARGAELRDGAETLVGEFGAADGPARVVPGTGGQARVLQPDDITGVLLLPDSERKRAFLHLILRTLALYFDGATPRALLEAAADVRAADFINTWTWPEGDKLSPSRDWRTVVTVLHELRDWQIRLEVLDRRALPAFEQVLVRGERPDAPAIEAELGELAWDEPRRIVLRAREAARPPVVVELPSGFA